MVCGFYIISYGRITLNSADTPYIFVVNIGVSTLIIMHSAEIIIRKEAIMPWREMTTPEQTRTVTSTE